MRRQLNIKKALATVLAVCLINHCRQAQRTRRIQKTLPLAKAAQVPEDAGFCSISSWQASPAAQ